MKNLLATTALTLTVGTAVAAAGCDKVTFSDVGWTDITATTAAATVVLDALGYETEIKILSVPVTYTSMAAGDIDVFLGNWMPTMEADIAKYRDEGTVDTVRANLEGAKYTLAVNKAAADMGITSFDAIAAKADALDGKIYGIEPGNDGNRLIQSMIDDDAFGLKDFEVVGFAQPNRRKMQVDHLEEREILMSFFPGNDDPVEAVILQWCPKPGSEFREVEGKQKGRAMSGDHVVKHMGAANGIMARFPAGDCNAIGVRRNLSGLHDLLQDGPGRDALFGNLDVYEPGMLSVAGMQLKPVSDFNALGREFKPEITGQANFLVDIPTRNVLS